MFQLDTADATRPLAAAPPSVLPPAIGRAAQSLAGAAAEAAFLYDPSIAARRAARLRAELPRGVEIAYAVKANAFEPVVAALAAEVDGFDVSSAGELQVVGAVRPCDRHLRVVAAGPGKELAARDGRALTFMPKTTPARATPAACTSACATPAGRPRSQATANAPISPDGPLPRRPARLPGGLHAALRADAQRLQAPARRKLRPDRDRLGRRQPPLRDPRRRRLREPALRAPCRRRRRQPHLAVAAIVAAGLHGLEHDLDLPAATEGPPAGSAPPLPASLEQARARWLHSSAARCAFGDDVVEHLARAAQGALDAFAASVTDWERERAFARL